MPRQILFVQGAGEGAHDQWDDKLVQSLKHELGEDYIVRYPRMPNEADPRYVAWKTALLKELDDLEDGAILIGHSVGGTILIHVLADEHPKFNPGALILVSAPFMGDGGWQSDDIARTDLSGCLPTGAPILLYHGTGDDIVPFAHARLYSKAIPDMVVRALPGLNHQLNDDLCEVARDIRLLPW